jgi:hypothetical protein
LVKAFAAATVNPDIDSLAAYGIRGRIAALIAVAAFVGERFYGEKSAANAARTSENDDAPSVE